MIRRAVRHRHRVEQDVAAAGDLRRGVYEHPRHSGEAAAEVGDAAGRRVVVLEDQPIGDDLSEDIVERRRERVAIDDVQPPAESAGGAADAGELVAARLLGGRAGDDYLQRLHTPPVRRGVKAPRSAPRRRTSPLRQSQKAIPTQQRRYLRRARKTQYAESQEL